MSKTLLKMEMKTGHLGARKIVDQERRDKVLDFGLGVFEGILKSVASSGPLHRCLKPLHLK